MNFWNISQVFLVKLSMNAMPMSNYERIHTIIMLYECIINIDMNM